MRGSTLCSVLQPFTGFMTFLRIYTNVWFHSLLDVTPFKTLNVGSVGWLTEGHEPGKKLA